MLLARTTPSSLVTNVGRGALAGVVSSVVMTGFQKFIEMPMTGREDSYGPAELAQKVLPVHASGDAELKRLNYATHTALGVMWGAAYGVAAHQGLHGPRAVAVTFAAIYSQNLITITALGLAKPWEWSPQDWTIDVVDKAVNIATTGTIFDRVLGPAARS